MNVDDLFLVVILIGGLFVTFFGINFYRYAVIIMSAAGGYMLGQLAFSNVVSDLVGEGVFREMDGSAGYSFVLGVCVIAGAALGFFLYEIMGAIVAGVGGGFMFARLFQAFLGRDMSSILIGAVIGGLIGIVLGIIAVKYERWVLILFTSLCGARIAGYTGAYLLSTTSFAATLAKPCVGFFSRSFPECAIEMAIALELFVVLTILGNVGQRIIRDD